MAVLCKAMLASATMVVLGAALAAAPSRAQQVTAGTLSPRQNVGDPVGSCSYGSLAATTFPGTNYVASVGANLPLLAGIPMNGCGACFRLVCSDTRPDACAAKFASVTVQVVDLGGGQLISVPAAALSQIATPAVGNLEVNATQVPCPQVGNVIVRIIDGSAASLYLKLVLLNAGPIRGVGVASAGSQVFSPLANTYGAVWETNRLPTAPLDLQYTDASGLTHLARNAIPASAGVGADIPVTFGGSSSSGAEKEAPSAAEQAPSPAVGPPGAAEPPLLSMTATAPEPSSSPVTVSASVPAPGPPVIAEPPLVPMTATAPALNASPVAVNSSAPAPAPVAPPNTPAAAMNSSAPANTSGAETIASAPSPAPAMPSTSPAANLSVMAPAPAPSNASSEAPLPGNTTTFDLKAAVGSGANCSSIFSVLALDPDLRNWTALLKAQGVDGTLNNTQQSLTVFAPINSAFTETVFAPNDTMLANALSVQDLVGSQPASANPIIGYHILPSAHKTTDFRPGSSLNTTDTIKGTGVAGGVTTNIPVNFTTSSAGSIQIQGVGSSADILQGDIPACGPSFIHIIDHVLLPFNPKASTNSTAAPVAMEMSPTSAIG